MQLRQVSFLHSQPSRCFHRPCHGHPDATTPPTIGPQPHAWPAMKKQTTISRPMVAPAGRLPSGVIWVAMTAVMAISAAIIWKDASTSQNLRPRLLKQLTRGGSRECEQG